MNAFIRLLSTCSIAVALAACSGGSSVDAPTDPGPAIIGLALDNPASPSKLYVADANRDTMDVLDLATNTGSVLAGLFNTAGVADGSGTNARFNGPFAVTQSPSGLLVLDTFNSTLRRVTTAGVVTTLAGSGGNAGSSDGSGSAARFYLPKGVAVDAAGAFAYVLDTYNQTLRKVDLGSNTVSTFAGVAGTVGYADGNTTAARFNYPFGLTIDGAGNLYVSDAGNNAIRVVTPLGAVSTLAGSSSGTAGSSDGSGGGASFNTPAGIATDGTNLFVADSENHVIRKIVIATKAVSTFAGLAGTAGLVDGPGLTTARFYRPTGLTMDNAGNLYVSDQFYTVVRKITAAGVVSTLPVAF